MPKPTQKKFSWIYLEDIPSLPKTTKPAPKKETPPPESPSQTQPKPIVEDFTALVTERPSVVQAAQKQ